MKNGKITTTLSKYISRVRCSYSRKVLLAGELEMRNDIKIKLLCKVAGMIICLSFTFCVIVMAAVSKGGLLYFYEPNIFICVGEIIIGIFGISVLLLMIYEIIQK